MPMEIDNDRPLVIFGYVSIIGDSFLIVESFSFEKNLVINS